MLRVVFNEIFQYASKFVDTAQDMQLNRIFKNLEYELI